MLLFSSFRHRAFATPLALALLAGFAVPALAADHWTVARDASTITFSGTQAGAPFTGTFITWTADIAFSREDLAASAVTVTIETASAVTGDAQKDANLPTPNWFNASASPEATFVTTAIATTGDGYLATGTLTIRGIAKPVELPFTLAIDGDTAEMSGSTTVKRSDFGIGAGIPPEMIADAVTIDVRVSATRQK